MKDTARTKIFFADDQIPEDDIPDYKIIETLKERYPRYATQNDYLEGYLVLRKAVNALRASDCKVEIATTYDDAISKANERDYDIAIVDLGWDNLRTLPEKERDFAGWDISEALENRDKKLGKKPTPQIIFSNKFAKDEAASSRAAQELKLPLYKTYNEAGSQALRAAVEFIRAQLNQPDPFLERLKQKYERFIDVDFIQQQRWFLFTAVFVGVSLILLLIGLSAALFGMISIGVVTSASSIITGAISLLLFTRLDKTQKDLKASRAELVELISKWKTEYP